MKQLGHPYTQLRYVVGLHDFEQFNKDIFRKSLFHSRKHVDYLSYLAKIWLTNAPDDSDYSICLDGLSTGLNQPLEALSDVSNPIFNQQSSDFSIEKPPLSAYAFTLNDINHIISNYRTTSDYLLRFPFWAGVFQTSTH